MKIIKIVIISFIKAMTMMLMMLMPAAGLEEETGSRFALGSIFSSTATSSRHLVIIITINYGIIIIKPPP